MKQLAIIALVAACASSAYANNFSGFGVGVELGTQKYDVDIPDEDLNPDDYIDSKNTFASNLNLSYALPHDNKLVSLFEAEVSLNQPELLTLTGANYSTNLKLDREFTVGYGLGYQVTNNILPYAKLNYVHQNFEANDTDNDEWTFKAKGFGVNLGAKYAVNPNIELGAEYGFSKTKVDTEESFKTNRLNIGATYRF